MKTLVNQLCDNHNNVFQTLAIETYVHFPLKEAFTRPVKLFERIKVNPLSTFSKMLPSC